MSNPFLAIKVDVDTYRGTRIGVPNLVDLFRELDVNATFFFSLGPDNTGRAIKRVLRPGFLGKVKRSNVVALYGIRTLLNGVLLPGPHIGKRAEAVLRSVHDQGHEAGIHCYDHIRWQDGLAKMGEKDVFAEFAKARREFERVFREPARSAGAAGWQANGFSLSAYDDAGLLYASDARGTHPFFPRVGDRVFKTLQIPTTLPTLDELLGRPEYPEEHMVEHYLSLLKPHTPNVITVHAEIEGMKKLSFFRSFLERLRVRGALMVPLRTLAQTVLRHPETVPVCELIAGTIDGRSGTLALQRCV